MNITIRPTLVKDLNPGDIFRDGGQNFRIAGLERDEKVVEITYYIGLDQLVNSFYLSPDDTLDLVIEEDRHTLPSGTDPVTELKDGDIIHSSVPIARTN